MKARNHEEKTASHDNASGDIFASPESKRKYNRTLFTTVAPQYTTATRVLSFGRDQSWKRELLEECVNRFSGGERSRDDTGRAGADATAGAGMRILDLACGTGDLTLALAERFPHAEILGVDLNPEMLAEAERRLTTLLETRATSNTKGAEGTALDAQPPERTGSVRFIEADMAALPFEDARFSVITAGYALRNAPDLLQALGEIRRVLQPGGLLAVLEFSRSPSPVLSWASVALLRVWGSLWGMVLHQDASVYAYIARSLSHYPDRTRFTEILKEHGFSSPDRRLRMFGLLELCFTHNRTS